MSKKSTHPTWLTLVYINMVFLISLLSGRYNCQSGSGHGKPFTWIYCFPYPLSRFLMVWNKSLLCRNAL